MSDNGYIQSKQRDLMEELKNVETKTKSLEITMKHLEDKYGKYDTLISKIKDYEKYQDKLKQDMEKEFKEDFDRFLDDLRNDCLKQNSKIIREYSEKWKNNLKEMTLIISDFNERIDRVHADLGLYISIFSEFIFMLTKKKVITEKEAENVLEKALRISDALKDLSEKQKDKLDKIFSKMGI